MRLNIPDIDLIKWVSSFLALGYWLFLLTMRVQLIAIFCAAVFTAGLIYDSVVYLNYLMHQNEITELFCRNKAEPEMHCNGKCHLKDMLKKDQDDSEKRSSREIEFELLTILMLKSRAIIQFYPWYSHKHSFADVLIPNIDGHYSIEIPPPR